QVEGVMRVAKARFGQMLEESLKRGEISEPDREQRRARRQADFFDALAKVAGMTPEEQVNVQIACLTQGVLDCAMRVAGSPEYEDEDQKEKKPSRDQRVPAFPPDARRSFRSAEIHNQAQLAHATARLMETISPIGGATIRHEFSYEHLHRHMPSAEAEV